jgi:hypothetical protein
MDTDCFWAFWSLEYPNRLILAIILALVWFLPDVSASLQQSPLAQIFFGWTFWLRWIGYWLGIISMSCWDVQYPPELTTPPQGQDTQNMGRGGGS